MSAVADPGIFVPAFPTFAPGMALHRREAKSHYPFSAPTVRYFYFARNAIWQTVKMLRLDRGEVLVPAYHHGVEIEALMDAGAAVKFYRVGARFEIDLADVEKRITSRTTALYLTHFAGFPGPVRAMKRLAEKYGLPLIEDCALSLFSMDGDLPLGVTGDISIFCLYKVLPVPNGGALTINGPERETMPELLPPPFSYTFSLMSSSMLRNMALRGGKVGRYLRRLALGVGKSLLRASNSNTVLTGTQHFNREHLILGISGLTKQIVLGQDVPRNIATRRRNYLFLLDRLRDLSKPMFDTLPDGVVPLFYPLLVEDNRLIMERLVARGIEAVDFWRAFHPACDPGEFPEVAKLRTSVVEIPCHQDLSERTMVQMVEAVRSVLKAESGRRLSAV